MPIMNKQLVGDEDAKYYRQKAFFDGIDLALLDFKTNRERPIAKIHNKWALSEKQRGYEYALNKHQSSLNQKWDAETYDKLLELAHEIGNMFQDLKAFLASPPSTHYGVGLPYRMRFTLNAVLSNLIRLTNNNFPEPQIARRDPLLFLYH